MRIHMYMNADQIARYENGNESSGLPKGLSIGCEHIHVDLPISDVRIVMNDKHDVKMFEVKKGLRTPNGRRNKL